MNRPAKSVSRKNRSTRSTDSGLCLYIDGAARGNPGPAGAGVLLADSKGRSLREISVYLGEATNNVAETIALIIGLQEALRLGARKIAVFTDSELLARQVTGEYRVKDRQLGWLHAVIRNGVEAFDGFEITHLPREQNKRADRLANRAVDDGLKRNPGASRRSSPEVETPGQPSLFG